MKKSVFVFALTALLFVAGCGVKPELLPTIRTAAIVSVSGNPVIYNLKKSDQISITGIANLLKMDNMYAAYTLTNAAKMFAAWGYQIVDVSENPAYAEFRTAMRNYNSRFHVFDSYMLASEQMPYISIEDGSANFKKLMGQAVTNLGVDALIIVHADYAYQPIGLGYVINSGEAKAYVALAIHIYTKSGIYCVRQTANNFQNNYSRSTSTMPILAGNVDPFDDRTRVAFKEGIEAAFSAWQAKYQKYFAQ